MKTIPHLPKWFATPFAKPYVAGETAQEALKKCSKIKPKRF